ncbi:hypothetical protein TWF281_000800 [Arthrobotrys megalospora]
MEESTGIENKQYRLKIGTFENHLWQLGCMIKPEYRKNREKLNELIATARKIAAPPRSKEVYEIKSQYLGTWAVLIDMVSFEAFEGDDREFAAVNSLRDMMSGIGWVVLGLNAFGAKEPGWLKPLDIANRKSKKRSFPIYEHDDTGRYYSSNEKRGFGDDTANLDIRAVRSRLRELQIISQPPDASLDDMGEFNYNEINAGEGVTVYVIDSGFDSSHTVLPIFLEAES